MTHSPTSDGHRPPPPPPPVPFRPPAAAPVLRARIAIVVIAAHGLLNIPQFIQAIQMHALINPESPMRPRRLLREARAFDDRWLPWNGLNFLMLVAWLVVVIVWLYAARKTTESYPGWSYRRSSGWTIGAWFCPVVHAWFPYQCMADTWVASDTERPDNVAFKSLSPSPLALWWWLFTVVTSITAYVSFRMYLDPDSLGALDATTWLDEISAVTDMVASVLLIVLIMRITRFQLYRHANTPRYPLMIPPAFPQPYHPSSPYA